MSPQTLEKPSIDWFDAVKQQLDELRLECRDVEDKSTVPPESKFEEAKVQIEKLHRLAGFPKMPDANIWLGPSGELGITWRFPDAALELLFANSMYARIYDEKKQARLKISEVSRVLSKLVKGAA